MNLITTELNDLMIVRAESGNPTIKEVRWEAMRQGHKIVGVVFETVFGYYIDIPISLWGKVPTTTPPGIMGYCFTSNENSPVFNN